MATPSDRLPFTLTFFQGDREITITEFHQSELEKFDPVAEITENVELSIVFDSEEEDAKFYMDGLEMLPEKVVDVDENRLAYLPPSDDKVALFKSTKDYYPLIPGFYRIVVQIPTGNYYTLIRVVPKQMTSEQWEIMRDELEAELRGLAQDLVRKNLGIGHSDLRSLPVLQLMRFMVIENHYQSVMAALNDLIQKVNSKIRKEYRLVPAERAKAMDEETIRYQLTHPEDRENLKTPVRELYYDLPENRWVCWIVRIVSLYLDEIIDSLREYDQRVEMELINYRYDNYVHERDKHSKEVPAYVREKRKVLEALHRFSDKATNMKHGLQMIKLAPWYQEVVGQGRPIGAIPPVMQYDPRYRALYQLYRNLKSNQFEIELDSSYAYQWKRTDRLYEMWGFLKFCRVLVDDLNFEPTSGWVYDVDFTGNRVLIPLLPANTKIVFAKDDLRLELVYNATLYPKGDSRHDDTLFINLNYFNTPDGRIDVYKDNVYIGTVMLEFKYRPINNFWDPSKKIHTRRPVATNQIISYHSDSSSNRLFGDAIPDAIRPQLRPVVEVWAIYPTGEPFRDPNIDYVRFLRVTPGQGMEKLAEGVMGGLERVQDFYKDYISGR